MDRTTRLDGPTTSWGFCPTLLVADFRSSHSFLDLFWSVRSLPLCLSAPLSHVFTCSLHINVTNPHRAHPLSELCPPKQPKKQKSYNTSFKIILNNRTILYYFLMSIWIPLVLPTLQFDTAYVTDNINKQLCMQSINDKFSTINTFRNGSEVHNYITSQTCLCTCAQHRSCANIIM